jgi:hypothetical protein
MDARESLKTVAGLTEFYFEIPFDGREWEFTSSALLKDGKSDVHLRADHRLKSGNRIAIRRGLQNSHLIGLHQCRHCCCQFPS